MGSSTDRLVVYGTSSATPRTVLGSATVGQDSAGQKLLCIDLSALPSDGRLELPIKDVLVLAEGVDHG
jgi:hypothetical protein